MKKLLSAVLVLTLCVLLFAGCNNKEEVSQPEENIVSPLPVTIDVNNLEDCTVAVSFEKGDIFVDDSGKMQMTVTVYAYDLYDMADIASLKEGDTIIQLGEEVLITEIERKDTGLININGGEEMGGFDMLSNDSNVYYQIGMNDVKSYYELGTVTLPVSTEFEYLDESDLDTEAKKYYPGDFLTDDAGIEYNFHQHNTSIVIEDGVVIRMNKTYIP